MSSSNPDDARSPWSAASGDAGISGPGQTGADSPQPGAHAWSYPSAPLPDQPAPPYAPPTAFPAYQPISDPQPYAPPTSYQQQPYGPVYPSHGPVNPYAVGPGSYYGQVPSQHPQAVLALVFGIAGLPFICFFLSIPAMIIGRKVQKETRAEPGRWTGGGLGTAGFALGVVSTVLWGAYTVLMVVLGLSGQLD